MSSPVCPFRLPQGKKNKRKSQSQEGRPPIFTRLWPICGAGGRSSRSRVHNELAWPPWFRDHRSTEGRGDEGDDEHGKFQRERRTAVFTDGPERESALVP